MALYDDILILIESNLVSNSEITADRHREVETALLNYISGSFRTGDIKEVDCTEAYIAANFDGTGLGINEREGWAICNGQNGTKDRNGRVAIARGTVYPSVGTSMGSPVVGGSETHTLLEAQIPQHSHKISNDNGGGVSGGAYLKTERDSGGDFKYGLSSNGTVPTLYSTSTFGGGQSHNNMQPYIVSLFIMKR